ncbi:unnamed protein product, partial [Bubo scandiacus]
HQNQRICPETTPKCALMEEEKPLKFWKWRMGAIGPWNAYPNLKVKQQTILQLCQ